MDGQDNNPQVIQDASVESILAEKSLEKFLLTPGTMCPYNALKEALGKDPQRQPTYGYVMTARRRFERKHNCVLDAVINEGIRWLTAEEVVRHRWDRDISHIRRSTRSTLTRQKTTLTEEAEKVLGADGIKLRNQNLAFAGVLSLMSKPKTERKIAAATDQANRVLPASEALEYFKGE